MQASARLALIQKCHKQVVDVPNETFCNSEFHKHLFLNHIVLPKDDDRLESEPARKTKLQSKNAQSNPLRVTPWLYSCFSNLLKTVASIEAMNMANNTLTFMKFTLTSIFQSQTNCSLELMADRIAGDNEHQQNEDLSKLSITKNAKLDGRIMLHCTVPRNCPSASTVIQMSDGESSTNTKKS